jgi:hypothetical protein
VYLSADEKRDRIENVDLQFFIAERITAASCKHGISKCARVLNEIKQLKLATKSMIIGIQRIKNCETCRERVETQIETCY